MNYQNNTKGELINLLKKLQKEHDSLKVQHQNEFIELNNATQLLKTSLETQDAVLSTTNVLAAYMDRDFNFIAVNKAYADAGKMSREEFVGKNHFDLYPYKDNEKIFKEVVDSGKAKNFEAKEFEYTDQPERGKSYWDWSLIPIKDKSGNVTTLVFSLLNVTERKKTEIDFENKIGRAHV